MLEKCILKYLLVQRLVNEILQTLVTNSLEASSKFERFLQILLDAKWLSAQQCGEVFSQFEGLVVEV